ncbi:MAG: Aspartyl/glutamyl-tRNA(Asn/Gln) amidotransferase subunit [Gemmatimonadetes bacterium]|nr:Aspartyl/glutamyl-tRNA(Asn/Gln) amidotransferase subunit [Gemmatimonadota bacterium]
MSITLDDVRHIATLARLGVTDERANALVTELNGILAHMDALSAVDTDGVREALGVGTIALPLRTDDSRPLALARPLESFAPSVRESLLLVPRLSSHESASE